MEQVKVATNVASGFDFSGVAVPEKSEYLKPGLYWLQIAEAKFEKPEGMSQAGKLKSPYIETVWKGKSGQLTEKFYVSPSEGLMKRLQYLHFATTGKELTKAFKSIDEVGKYFVTLLNDSRITSKQFATVVSGKEANNNKIYSCLGYVHFIVDADLAKKSGFEETVFEVGSDNYNNHIIRDKANASHKTDDVIIPSSIPDESSDLPF